ncbi:TrbC/VirB2 family protein [Lonsdalea quercina]|uniref:TrbC/VirB2 family protein n=1 Tax=Lonsdalea quercina TaxID=71657 RepID=UPI003975A494
MMMKKGKFWSVVILALLSLRVLAADGGFNKANETLSNTSTGLLGLAAVTITLATMWIGYKVLFDGKSLHDMRNVIIGAILIVGASGFGAYWAA